MSKPGPVPMEKPAWHPADDLTEMQRRFVDFLAYRQGRATYTQAAIQAGYSEKRANREGSELMKNPKVQKYYRWKCNQINRSLAVNHTNYINHQIRLSTKVANFNLTISHNSKQLGLFNNSIPSIICFVTGIS